jgi:UDP-N-acetylmuramoyl-L-alanyl-D-glutamate--2,6-diaminopimelate ligase
MGSFLKSFVPESFLSFYHRAWAVLGASWYRYPSRRLTVIGITGTNGKSSVVWILARILEGAGLRVAVSSSIEFQIADRHFPNEQKMTMPGRAFLQRFLRDAVAARCSHAIIEVTSEGIRQHRHRGIDWDLAVIMNMSPEHIERHGSYEAYRAAKGELFAALSRAEKVPPLTPLQTSVVNLGDREAPYFLSFPAKRRIGFRVEGVSPKEGGVSLSEVLIAERPSATSEGITFSLRGYECASPLLGFFNIENALGAIAAAIALGVPLETCVSVLRTIAAPPGRLEEIPNERGIRIFVDYAHNPDALTHVYETLHTTLRTPERPIANLTCILGAAGGGRDRWKRRELGKIAAHACRYVIVTDEDPYDEDPSDIRRAVIEGVRSAGGESRLEEIPDRRLAIRRAIQTCGPGGTIVITGKGSEPWMMLRGGKRLLWDDRRIVHEELEALERSERLALE